MYLPQPFKSLLVLAGIAAVLFAAYQHPYVRSLVNREAAKQGIVIDPKSPEAQILRANPQRRIRPQIEGFPQHR